MGLKAKGEAKAEKSRGSMVSRPRMKLWLIRATTTVLLWTCVVQLTAIGEMWGPRVLKGWPSCFTHSGFPTGIEKSSSALSTIISRENIVLPPKSEFFFAFFCAFLHHCILLAFGLGLHGFGIDFACLLDC